MGNNRNGPKSGFTGCIRHMTDTRNDPPVSLGTRGDPPWMFGARGDPLLTIGARGDPPWMFGARGDPPVIKNNRDGPTIRWLIFSLLVGFFRSNGRSTPLSIMNYKLNYG